MREPIRDGQLVFVRERSFDPAECRAVGVTEKAVRLYNVVTGHSAWFPRAWLRDYEPADATYAGEYFVPQWVQCLSIAQERVLNIRE